MSTIDYLKLFKAREATFAELLRLSTSQWDRIVADEYDGLLDILGAKQRLLGRLEELSTVFPAVVERWRHGYDVFPDAGRTVPFGSGATCAWPVLDLQIVNPTSASFRLSLDVGETHLAGEWTATRPSQVHYAIEERAHRITRDGPATFVRRNELWRLESDGTSAVTTERFLVANEAMLMYEPFLPGAGESCAAAGSVGQARRPDAPQVSTERTVL